MYAAALKSNRKIFAVAPMMEWTDRHCRVFHRILTKQAVLYTEMVTSGAVKFGDRDKIIGFSGQEQPVACQLGGSDPAELQESAKIVEEYGYREINLNIGCPSDRVQSGRFGACLMLEPDLVGDCVRAMKSAVRIPVTVKCRLGVDDQEVEESLDVFTDRVISAGADGIWVHARKAILKGLSPKQNRDVPPLNYDRVYRLKKRLPDTFVGINGGIASIEECKAHLEHVDGVMIGRAAYKYPWILTEVDELVAEAEFPTRNRTEVISEFMQYVDEQLKLGTKLSAMTRHILGLFHGMPGAKSWRRVLTEGAIKNGSGLEVIEQALEPV